VVKCAGVEGGWLATVSIPVDRVGCGPYGSHPPVAYGSHPPDGLVLWVPPTRWAGGWVFSSHPGVLPLGPCGRLITPLSHESDSKEQQRLGHFARRKVVIEPVAHQLANGKCDVFVGGFFLHRNVVLLEEEHAQQP